MLPIIRPPTSPWFIRYLLIPELGDIAEGRASSASMKVLSPILRKHLGDIPEHVAVLYEGQRRDMFVGETSANNGRRIRNIRATEIYRAAALALTPDADPETMPAISGPAVLFPNEIVWK